MKHLIFYHKSDEERTYLYVLDDRDVKQSRSDCCTTKAGAMRALAFFSGNNVCKEGYEYRYD